MTFNIGQIFEKEYPPEAAQWCNENQKAYIDEIAPIDGVRRFQIKAIPEPTEEEKNKQLQEHLTSVVQNFLDSSAQDLNYDSCLSVCSYVDTGVKKFDDEGKAFRSWRSVVWSKCYEILDEVLSKKRDIPTEEELLSELPKLIITYGD